MSHWLQGLNQEQQEAALHNHGPLLILAGAGSGKTTVLVARTGRLLEERIVKAERLCVLTFTNKAARELKTRVAGRLGKEGKGIWAGTFHSFGLQILRRHHREAHLSEGFGILDSGDANALVKEILSDFHNGKSAYDAERILSMISQWRENQKTKAEKDDEYEEAVEWLLPRYLKRLEHLGMVDFDSLILRPLELMNESDSIRSRIQQLYDQVMVDEFQDTNQMQMRLIQKLVEPHRNLAVVGDDDQSIYGWRGACISNILNFPKLYSQCKVVRLEQNYRSTPAILNLANAIIAKNAERHHKVLRPRPGNDAGEIPEVVTYDNESEESEFVANDIAALIREGLPRRDIAVLYRSNSQGALMEAELRRHNIPYLMSGGTAFFDRKETRDILAYLRCSLHPNEVAFRRILNTPPRGIGEKTVENLTTFSRTKYIPFVTAAEVWRQAGVDEKAGTSIDALFTLLKSFVGRIVKAEGNSGEALLQIFKEIGYKQHLEKHSPNSLVAAKRWKFVEIFASILDRYIEKGGKRPDTVKEFLDNMELRDALNDKKENEDRVQLLTLHACKGLEFPHVFLLGLEEDIIPHKVLGSDVSEERRLFYVGVTRAQKRLTLTRTLRRRKYGKWIDVAPSRFLLEIPKGLFFDRQGPRPMNEQNRKSMLAELYAKLDFLDGSSSSKA